MLFESLVFADSITSSPVDAPWSVVESASASQVNSDLCACWDWVVLRRRTAKDTSPGIMVTPLGLRQHQGQG